jgi:predicted neuraminidase
MKFLLYLLIGIALFCIQTTEKPDGRLIFPLNSKHNHGSCIVELPNRDLLACWYRGSGERTADDVQILGSRLKRGSATWSEPFVMADTDGFPDCNPCMIVAPDGRLWLFWPTILNNRWESALLKYRVTSDLRKNPKVEFKEDGVLHLKPGPEFQQVVERDFRKVWEPYGANADSEQKARLQQYLTDRLKVAKDPLSVRLGWMPRVHPVIHGGRMLLPLYSDGFDFSLIAISDDRGKTWKCSAPIVGAGNVQPSIVKRRDGTLVAYFRDNGPPPQRVMVSESRDCGETWSTPTDSDVVDTGAGVEALTLRSGRWILVNNDTENGRHRLTVTLSEDEGRTWSRRRRLENDAEGPDSGSYSYPSIIQSSDGSIHATYSYRPPRSQGTGSSIKYVRFPESWLLE